MRIAYLENALKKSWLTGAVMRDVLRQPVLDARLVCHGDEAYVRKIRDALESVFKLWQLEHGTLPNDAHGGLLGNIYAGKPLAECPPYACMGEWGTDYFDLLARLKNEKYPALMQLEDAVSHPPKPTKELPKYVPRLPAWDSKPGLQQILAALILSEAVAENIDVVAKAHWQLRRILDENEWRTKESLQAAQKVIHALATTGAKFKQGRKVNTGGPIRKAIARELKRNPSLMPRHLWAKLASKPPKGWEFCDNSEGKYIEGPKGGEGMGYARFSEVCKEERDKLAP